jgi:lipopolysaccharide transport system permease protein
MTEIFVIEAGRAERQYWRDLWKFRELFYFLAWRDFLIRYKQTVVGIAWSLIRPLLMMLALTMIGKIGKSPTGGAPYALFFFCGLLPWQFFSTALSESGNSLVTNSNLVSKIYFPRLVVPASSVIVSFVDFLIAAAFLVVLMFYYHFTPPSQVVFIPLFVFLVFAASLGAGFWIAALTVEYRDFRFVIPFIVQFGMFISSVLMMTSHVPERWRLLYSVNPMVGIIDGFRWCILGGGNAIYVPGLVSSLLVTFLLIFSGLWYFRKTERTFADVI